MANKATRSRKRTQRPRTTKSKTARARTPRARKAGSRGASALAAVEEAQTAARRALKKLQGEIAETRDRLEKLEAAEQAFREELLEASSGSTRPRRRTSTAAKTGTTRRRRRKTARPKRPPKAEKFFQKLPKTFTIEDVRKVAGRASGVSLAQWSRSKRIRKSGDKYHKVA